MSCFNSGLREHSLGPLFRYKLRVLGSGYKFTRICEVLAVESQATMSPISLVAKQPVFSVEGFLVSEIASFCGWQLLSRKL